jgi:EpsI family protein
MTIEKTPGRGPILTRRAVIVGGAMAFTAVGAYAATPRRAEHRLAKQKLGSLIATQVGPWRYTSPAGVIVAREDEGEPVDGYDQVLTRVYDAPGLPSIMLLLAYGSTQGGSLQLHRPETCYPGQGFKLSDFSELNYAFLPGQEVHARRFTASRDDRIERIVYWTRISRTFPRNTAEEYAAIFGGVFNGVIPDGLLVRISTLGGDIAESDAAISQFAHDMVQSASAPGRTILLGRT